MCNLSSGPGKHGLHAENQDRLPLWLLARWGEPALTCRHAPQEQASWVCQCEESVVQRLQQDFKLTLQQRSSLDQWATWLDSVVTQVLKEHAGSPSFPKAARQFLLKWSFYR